MSASELQLIIILCACPPHEVSAPTVERLIAMNIVVLILVAIVIDVMREKK